MSKATFLTILLLIKKGSLTKNGNLNKTEAYSNTKRKEKNKKEYKQKGFNKNKANVMKYHYILQWIFHCAFILSLLA